MFILFKRKLETIQVAHNSAEEMRESVHKLTKEGWSGNTRMWSTLEVNDELEWFKEHHPDVVIHPPEKGNYLRCQPYIYYTEHERTIKEENK